MPQQPLVLPPPSAYGTTPSLFTMAPHVLGSTMYGPTPALFSGTPHAVGVASTAGKKPE